MDGKILKWMTGVFGAVCVLAMAGGTVYAQGMLPPRGRSLQQTPPGGRSFKLPKEVERPTGSAPTPSESGVLLLDDKGAVLRLTMSGVGHARWAGNPEYPFPVGWESSLSLKAQPNKSLTFDIRFDMNQQRASDRYSNGATLVPNVAATWTTDFSDPEIFQLVTRVGDLRRMTSGKGLIFKDMNESGAYLQFQGHTQRFTLSYLLNGLVASTDIVMADWSNLDRTLGTYAQWTLNESESGATQEARLAAYGKLSIFKWFDVDWEATISGANGSKSPGYSVLVAPYIEGKYPDFYWMSRVSYRGYFGSTLDAYPRYSTANTQLASVRTDLFDEDMDLESLRSILILGGRSETLQSVAGRWRMERLLFGSVWGFGDVDTLNIIPKSGSIKSITGFSAGIKLALSQHHYGYFAVQNKFLNSTTPVNGDSFTLTNHVVDSVLVAGVKFKF